MVLDLVLLILFLLSTFMCLILKVREEDIFIEEQKTLLYATRLKMIPSWHKACFSTGNIFSYKETPRGEKKDFVSLLTHKLSAAYGFFLFKILNAIIEI